MANHEATRSHTHLLSFAAIVIAIAALYFARVVFVPFALAVLFTFLLTPVVTVLDRLKIPRGAAAFAVVALTMVVLGSLAAVVAGQLVEVANQLPQYRAAIAQKIESIPSSRKQGLHRAAAAVSEVKRQLASALPSTNAPGPSVDQQRKNESNGPITPVKPVPVEVVPAASTRFESLNGVIGPLTTSGIVVVFTLFMLIRREDLRNRFIRLVGHGRLSVTTQALDDASQRVSRYLSMQVSVNVAFGTVVGTGLYFIGIPHAVLWGATAAMLRFLPYVGGFLSVTMPALLSIAMFNGWAKPLLILVLYAGLEIVLVNIIEPHLYGTQVGMSSLAILVAAIFWAALWGPVGLLLSTPLTVCLVVIGRYVPELAFLNVMLGDEPVLTPEKHFYQRLLAHDAQEAQAVVEKYLGENGLRKLYNLVLIPALTMAQQDRQRNDVDEATRQFVGTTTRDFVEELWGKTDELAAAAEASEGEKNEEPTAPRIVEHVSPGQSKNIACVPARDDFDEIAGVMLAQLLENAGHRPQNIPVGPVDQMVDAVRKAKAEIVCISALPPFAISHARSVYKRLSDPAAAPKILVGLWGLTGDMTPVTARLNLREGDRILNTLEEALAETNGLMEARPSSAAKGEAAAEIEVPSD